MVSHDVKARRAYSLRIPDHLYSELARIAEEKRTSMNSLIATALAQFVGSPELAPVEGGGDISPSIAQEAIRGGPEAIRALKRIARRANDRDQVALAAVLWAAAARLIAAQEGPAEASRELALSAETCEQSNQRELAVALYEQALELDANNLPARSRLGQLLHHLAQQHDDLERYRQAERHLALVTFLDNHAKLFHGWSALRIAHADGDPHREEHALAEIEEALKSWAFGKPDDGQERRRWLRQVKRLVELGQRDRAEELLEFANRNAYWQPFEPGELTPRGR